MKKFSITTLKREINSKYGSVAKLKAHLKKTAKYQWGGHFNEIELYGCKISYNDNPNCFANYIITIPHVGFSSQMALSVDSITKAGRLRLGNELHNHYISI